MQHIISIRLLYVISCIFYAVTSTILRLPCMTDANFNVVEDGKRLKGNVISKHHGTTNVQCTIFCVQNQKCRSYNINQAKLMCELNSKALADSGTELVDDKKWQYKSTNYSSPWVGPLCRTQKPCQNGVFCRDSCSAPFYECIKCDANNTGLNCNAIKEADQCKVKPCKNGGECVSQMEGRKCNCKKGYTGKNCEVEIDECDSLPCFNGGICENKIGSFACTCAAGYTGVHCETDINECGSGPCANGGTCEDKLASFRCTCAQGFTGVQCETDINECDNSPCANGGTCRNTVGSFNCDCSAGYTGALCQTVLRSCIDLYRHGKRWNAVYEIIDQNNQRYKVYCDFDSDTDSVWTLITSFSLSNKEHFKVPLFTDSPRNENSLDWNDFRFSLERMRSIRSSSTIWRSTCSFLTYKSDLARDYVRAQLQTFNLIEFNGAECKMVDYINIRGHEGSRISAKFYQNNDEHLHTDSSLTTSCSFDARQDSIPNEDNFGLYIASNTGFRCTESTASTTQYWLGIAK